MDLPVRVNSNYSIGGFLMDAGVHLKRLQKWAALVLEAEKSGNKSKWCKQNNISFRKYIYWQKLVRDYALEHGEDSLLSGQKLIVAAVQKPQFFELNKDAVHCVEGGSHSSEISSPQINPELMIQHGDFRIYVGSSISTGTLTAVLKAVKDA